MLTAVAGTAFVLVTVLVGRVLFVDLALGINGPLVMAMFVIGEIALAVMWLRRTLAGGGPHDRPAHRSARCSAGWRPTSALTPETETAVRAALQSLDAGTPWYLRVLMAFGAWIGTWFLLGFVLGILAIPFGGRIEGTAIVDRPGAHRRRRGAAADEPARLREPARAGR